MTATLDHVDVIPIADGTWTVDPERSETGFAAKSMWGLSTVRGAFHACHGSLTVGAQAVSGELMIDARSLDTGNRRRDRHLRSPDFLDAERHPWIRFELAAVTALERRETNAGTLRIGDTDTRLELSVNVEHTPDDAIRLDATTTISRAAAGVAWNWLGTIGDAIALHARITLVRTASASREAKAS